MVLWEGLESGANKRCKWALVKAQLDLFFLFCCPGAAAYGSPGRTVIGAKILSGRKKLTLQLCTNFGRPVCQL